MRENPEPPATEAVATTPQHAQPVPPPVTVYVPPPPLPPPPPPVPDSWALSPHLDVLPPRKRRELWLEFAVVLSFSVVPLLFSSLAAQLGWKEGHPQHWASKLVSFQIHNLSMALPLLWIMFRSGLPWRYYGINTPRVVRDVFLGLFLFLAMFAVAYFVQCALWVASHVPGVYALLTCLPAESQMKEGFVAEKLAPWGLFWLSLAITTSVEELFVRAYFVPALARLFRSPWPAIVIAAALMASYHFYQGSYSVIAIFLSQIPFNWFFWRFRSIWPFMVAHAAYDAVLFAMY